MHEHRLARTLAWVCAWKAVLLAIPVALWAFAPETFDAASYEGNFHIPGEPGSLAVRFRTWDAQHYLELALHGYRDGAISAWMYPLWPALIRCAGWVLGGPLVAGLVLAHACFLGACAILYRIVDARHGARAASFAVLALAAQPGSFFMGLVYTEALFVLLSLGFFLALFRRRWWTAAALGFLLPLNRTVGVFAVLPLACALWEERRAPHTALACVGVASAVIAGWAAYFGWIYLETGNPLAGIEAGAQFVSAPTFGKLVDPLGFLAELFRIEGFIAFRGGLLDRIFFAAYVALLLPIWRLCTRGEFVWAVALGFASAMAVSLMSFTRHVTVIFPIAIALGVTLARPEHARVARIALASSLLVQGLLLALHTSNHWVG